MAPNLSKNRTNIVSARELSRQLRKSQTEAELCFWERVRKRKFLGLRFIRQHPIFFEYYGKERYYIADFYCHEQKLVVEIDGPIHEKQIEEDELRDFIMNNLGIRVLRFKNEEIVNDMSDVLARISTAVP
jgi:very-short-patch-repair endonuclease